jgi:hypothetical protein
VIVSARGRFNGRGLIVRLAGPPDANDERRLHTYLQTWLAVAKTPGGPVSAELRQEQNGVRAITSATWLVRMRPD